LYKKSSGGIYSRPGGTRMLADGLPFKIHVAQANFVGYKRNELKRSFRYAESRYSQVSLT